jgi:oligoribonuclease NrnB/cAMP/cGMP phosphodiesterase (DHH superfamily)
MVKRQIVKTYILYHGNCPDGCGAATAAWIKLGDDAEYVPVSYGKPLPEMDAGSKVFIVDFSYPRQQLLSLAKRMNRVVVLDHHATAQQDLAGLELPGEDSEIQFDMSKSGAVLAWEFFQGEDVPDFILYLQDRDLWQFKLPKSREVSAAIGSYPMDFRTWANWLDVETIIDDLAGEGETCLRLKNQQVQNMVKHHRRAILDGKHKGIQFVPKAGENEVNGFGVTVEPDQWACPVSNASVFFSEVGEALLELYPDAPFSAYYADRADGKQQWGLRSRPEFDCSVIAKAFGGGGHKQASGFVV